MDDSPRPKRPRRLRWFLASSPHEAEPCVIELVVSDMDATLAFYRRVGLDVPCESDDQPHGEVDLPGGMRLAWDTEGHHPILRPGLPPESGHRVGLAFACESPAEVDAAWAELTSAGYEGHLAPWDAVWGMRYAVVRDPDGKPVDLFAPLPQS